MQIDELANYPEYMDTVAEWLNNEFGTKTSKEFYRGIVSHSVKANQLPITFIASQDNQLVGTIGLWRGDLLSRQDLFPWVSAIVVHEQYRNQGIGTALQQYILTYCRENRYEEVYLYTDIEGYYEKIGWELFDTGYEYSGNQINIYRYSLNK